MLSLLAATIGVMSNATSVANTIPEINIFKGGSWNEEGLVGSLDRKGFIPVKCVSELIANSKGA